MLREALSSPHAPVRAAALAWGLTRNSLDAFTSCAQWSDATDEAGRLSRWVLAIGGEPSHLERLLRQLDVPVLRREALWALGFSGRTVAAEACLSWLHDSKLAGIATEAFCAITGLSLTKQFRADREEASGDEDAPPDEDVSPDPDVDLEWPAPQPIERWWAEARPRFRNDSRYVAGRAFASGVLLDTLASATMRRRPVLALELAIRTRGQHAVEVGDFSHVQARQLAEARSSRGGAFWTGSFSARMGH